jgi:hypothetical protein
MNPPIFLILAACALLAACDNGGHGEVAFAAGTVGGAGVTFKNTVFSGHTVGNAWNRSTKYRQIFHDWNIRLRLLPASTTPSS